MEVVNLPFTISLDTKNKTINLETEEFSTVYIIEESDEVSKLLTTHVDGLVMYVESDKKNSKSIIKSNREIEADVPHFFQ